MTKRGKAWSKQRPETMVAICDALRAGIPTKRSAKMAGISYQTFQNWRSSGWTAIEEAPDDSTEPLPFVAKFAVEVEAALVEFMAPFLKRIRDDATGQGKGDWRAARAILEMRFPHEFSEKVQAATSARLEVSGQIDVAHQHDYQEFLNFRKMSPLELQFEIERLSSQVDHATIKGVELAAEIEFHQAKVAAMIEAHESGLFFNKSNWLARRPAVRVALPSPAELPVIDNDEDLAAESLPPDSAPILTGSATSSGEPLPVAPSQVTAVRRTISYDSNGLAFYPSDEDLSL